MGKDRPISRHVWGTTGFACLLVVGLLTCADPVRADDPIELEQVGPYTLFLAPSGAPGQMVIAATNAGLQAAPAITLAMPMSTLERPWYPLSMLPQPSCGALMPGSYVPFADGYHFSMGPFAPSQRVVCRIGIARAVDAASDETLGWTTVGFNGQPGPGSQSVGYFVGSLVDVSLDSTPISFSVDGDGRATGIVRLTVTNHGPSNVAANSIVGACTDNFPPPFDIDGNLDDGCGTNVGNACFDSGIGFALPALPATQSTSCLLKLTSETSYTGPLAFQFSVTQFVNQATGGSLLDTDISNNYAVLTLAPVAMTSTTPVPSLSAIGRIILALLLFSIVLLFARFRLAKPTGRRRSDQSE